MKTLQAIHQRHLLLALTPLAIMGAGAAAFHGFVLHAISTNVILNGIIIATAVGGAALMLLRIRAVRFEWEVFEEFAKRDPEPESRAGRLQQRSVAARLLGHLSRIRVVRSISGIEQSQLQEELEDVHRVLESRQEAAQYVVGLMIALGLLGTFIGLLETLVAMGHLIGGFATSDASQDMDKALTQLIGNLQSPLTAMGTAFSASMFGLLCSLMLGIMMLSVRAFQVEFMQFARSVVDEVTVDAQPHAAQPYAGAHSGDEVLWSARVIELQQMHEKLQAQIRAIAVQGEQMERRQRQLLTGLETVAELVASDERKVQDLTEHLASLPALLQSSEEARRDVALASESMTTLVRQGHMQHQETIRQLVAQTTEITAQVDRAHAEQMRRGHAHLVELLDQRLSAIEARGEITDVLQRGALRQNELMSEAFSAFRDANSVTQAHLQRLLDESVDQGRALREMTLMVASAVAQVEVKADRLTEALVTPRSDLMAGEVAYEVAQGAENLAREMRIGFGSVLTVLRTANADSSQAAVFGEAH